MARTGLSPQRMTDFRFPVQVAILPEIEEAFVKSGLAKSVRHRDKADTREKVLLYGVGDFYRTHERYLQEKYQIMAFIDRNKRGFLCGKEIVRLGGIKHYDYDKIILMLSSAGQCIEVGLTLLEQGVDPHKIVLGHDIVERNLCFWDKYEWVNGGLKLHIGKTRVTVAGLDEFNNVMDVHSGRGGYIRSICSGATSIILDVGMNIGSGTLYFLESFPNSIVYGYEPFKPTFEIALENLTESGYYPHSRVHVFNYGLSGHDEEKDIIYNRKMSCGQSTDEQTILKAREFYMNSKIATAEDDQIETIRLRQASAVIADIRKKHPLENMVLKLDCEGSEYAVVEDLEAAGILGIFQLIMLEWHNKTDNSLEEALEKAGYSFWSIPKTKSSDKGFILACKG
jgi:FkbM family methyltransferase